MLTYQVLSCTLSKIVQLAMEKIKNTLGISKGDGMSGIGVDQSALMENEDFARQATNPESSLDKGTNPKDINSAGGPSFGRRVKNP